MSTGYIKLHRSLLDWQYWDDHNTTRLLIYFLVSVNYESKKWKGIEIKPGSMITSYNKISVATKLSIKQIRRSIKILVNDRQVTQETASKFQLVTLVKWDELQSETSNEGRQRAGKGQAKGRQRATTKESIITNSNNTEEREEESVPNGTCEVPSHEDPALKIDFDKLLNYYNGIFMKKCTVVNDKARRQYKSLIRQGYSTIQIGEAMKRAKENEFHKANNWRHLTIEFFSRPEKVDMYAFDLDNPKKLVPWHPR